MTGEDRQKLREAANRAVAATPPRGSGGRMRDRWSLQTSNSFRRIGCHGDGDVLCGTKHPVDSHPDLRAPPDVLDYIVAAQPRVVLALLDALEAAETCLTQAQASIDRTDTIEMRLVQANASFAKFVGIIHDFTSDDPATVARAREELKQLTANFAGGNVPA